MEIVEGFEGSQAVEPGVMAQEGLEVTQAIEPAAVLTDYQEIPVDHIAVNPKNPRKTFDETELAELAETMRQVGIIEPLVVRPGGDVGYLLVAGERRLRAAKIAELATVPCVVRNYDDRQAREVQLVENLQRKNVTGIEEAQGFRELMDDYGYSAEQLAERVGKKPRVIYQRLALLRLPEAVKTAMAEQKLSTNHAILIARAPEARQIELMEEATENGMSVRELDHHIKREVTLKLDAAPFDRADAELMPSAGSCEDCPKRSGNARAMYSEKEIKSPDVCTDKDCYDEKVKQHVNRALAANRDLVQIKGDSYYWDDQPKHVLSPSRYTSISGKRDRCEHAVAAIIVHGGAVGTLAEVCIHPKCDKHKRHLSSGGFERSAADKAKARAERLKLDIARVLRDRVATAILDVGVRSHVELLEIALEEWWPRLGHDVQRLVRKRHPDWDADILPIGDLPEETLERLLNEFSLALHLQVWGCDRGGVGDALRERAEAAGVDWKAIEKAVTAELSAPKQKKASKLKRTGICYHDCCVASVYDGGKYCEAHKAEHEVAPEQPATEATAAKPKRGKKSTAPKQTLSAEGVESDNGVEIQFRSKAKGPVLAEVLLLRGPKAVGKSRKAFVEPGWYADLTVALKGEPEAKERMYSDPEKTLAFESTSPALFAAYTRIGELAVGIGGEALMVRNWTARKLAALAS